MTAEPELWRDGWHGEPDTPVSGQTWQSLTQPSRTITVTTADESWTHFTENQERTHRNEPKPGIVRTRDLPRNFRLTNPTP